MKAQKTAREWFLEQTAKALETTPASIQKHFDADVDYAIENEISPDEFAEYIADCPPCDLLEWVKK